MQLTYVMALFTTEPACHKETGTLLRSRLHMNVSGTVIGHSAETTARVILPLEGAVNLRTATILIIDTPVTNGGRDSILCALRLDIVAGPNNPVLQLSSSHSKRHTVESESKPVDGLIPRSTPILSFPRRTIVHLRNITVRSWVGTLSLSPIDNLMRPLALNREASAASSAPAIPAGITATMTVKTILPITFFDMPHTPLPHAIHNRFSFPLTLRSRLPSKAVLITPRESGTPSTYLKEKFFTFTEAG
ncbi:hypothetical protein CCONF_01695 [Corynebacterium confusum]|nr:hypothetical protein CCONF_01695 [Corynebacterium confusum]